jgi:hypothetical protein
MDLSLQHFLWHADEGEDMLNKIVIVEKSWVHHCQPKSKHASMQWKHPTPSNKILRLCDQVGKLFLPCFGILREYCQHIFRSEVKM